MKVLIVDDSKTCRNLYKRELERGGYETVEAADGLQALKVIQETPVDLVLLDIEMPNMNGYEVCDRLRSREFTTRFQEKKDGVLPVIFVTSNEALEWRVKGFNKGANGFITKGFKPGTLLANVNEVLKPPNTLNGLLALVVEESRFQRTMITGFLQEHGVEVIGCQSCEAAFDILVTQKDTVKMLITAQDMHGMTGKELAKKVRKDLGLRTLPVIILSDTDDRKELLNLFTAGATDYLVKPFEKEELITRLKASLEMVHTLEREIENRVWAQSTSDEDKEKALEQAKIATSVLHNIGNVLNSVFACCYQLSRLVKDSKLKQVLLAHQLIADHKDNLGDFFTNDPKGQLLPEYLFRSGSKVEDDHNNMAREIEEMSIKVNLMRDIIDAQQTHAKSSQMEAVEPGFLLREALAVQETNIKEWSVKVVEDVQDVGSILVHRVQLTHVLINLIKNAIEAMKDCDHREIHLSLARNEKGLPTFKVTDSGAGIDSHNMGNMFTHGFTTKEDGHGFGLAFCKRAIEEMGGELTVSSEGKGKGATFKIIFFTENAN